MEAIAIKQASLHYGNTMAYQDINLSVREGEMFGIIGPDGAGKTSLIRGICTLLKPQSGSIEVMGYDIRDKEQIRAILGYMPQKFSLYQDLSVEQNLQFYADLFQVPGQEKKERLQRLYQFSRLEPFKHRKAGALSGGMKQKLALSCNLIHTPQLLVLDEPTYGVDPVSRQEFWELLKAIQEQGVTILVSTPYMDEAEKFDRIALFFKGNILQEGTPAQVRKRYPFTLFQIKGNNNRDLQPIFQSSPLVQEQQLFGDCLHVSFKESPSQENWHSWQQLSKGNMESWELIEPSLEDVFLYQSGVKYDQRNSQN